MKKNNIIIIVSILLLIIGISMIVTAIVITNKEKQKTKKIDNGITTIEEKTKKIIDNTYLSLDTDKETIEKEVGQPMSYHDIYTGKDSFVENKPNNEVIKKYSLEDYEKLQAKYAPLVEKRFIEKSTYSYKKIDAETIKYNFKPWYYGAYASDLKYMLDTLVSQTKDITQEDMAQATEKYIVYEYKARVKSIYILNKYLSNYDNQDEEFEFIVKLVNGKISQEDQYSIYMNFHGNRSVKVPGTKDTSAVKSRVDNYIKEATNSKTIDLKDPLSIEGLS